MRMQKLEPIVKQVLEESQLARDDDFVLIRDVYRELNPHLVEEPFSKVLDLHKGYHLPSFESVTRARRKLQSEYKNLASSKQVEAMRAEEEENFREYARN